MTTELASNKTVVELATSNIYTKWDDNQGEKQH